MRRLVFLAAALVVASCSETTPRTQVMVVVRGEGTVQMRTDRLGVLISGGPAGGTRAPTMGLAYALANVGEEHPLAWPVRIALVPEGGDATRTYEVSVTAYEGATVVASQRVVGGYLSRETLTLDLWLRDDCIGVSCGDDEMCEAGGCVPLAPIDPCSLPDESGNVPAACRTPDGGTGDMRPDAPPVDFGPDGTMMTEDCDGIAATAIGVTGVYTTAQAWSGLVYVGGSATFQAGLTIAAGTQIVMGADATITISSGRIDAMGTAAMPVRVCGESRVAGHWRSIIISSSVNPASELTYLEIRHGGIDFANPLIVQSPVTLRNVLLEDNERSMSIGQSGLDPDSANLSVRGTTFVPALTAHPNALLTLPVGGTFEDNAGTEGIVYVLSGEITGSGTIPNLGLRYDVLGGFEIVGGAQVTIEAGADFLVNPSRTIRIGETGAPVVIVASGTAMDPILFRGRTATPGNWTGLVVGPNVSSTSRFDFITVSGGDAACFSALAPVTITGSSFVNCMGYGIGIVAGDMTDYATGNTFSNVGLGDVGVLP